MTNPFSLWTSERGELQGREEGSRPAPAPSTLLCSKHSGLRYPHPRLTIGVSSEPHGRATRAGQPRVSGQVGRRVGGPATRARQRRAPGHHEVGVQAVSSTAGGVQAGQVGQLLAFSGRGVEAAVSLGRPRGEGERKRGAPRDWLPPGHCSASGGRGAGWGSAGGPHMRRTTPRPHRAPKASPEQLLLVSVQPRPQQPLLPVPGPVIATVLVSSAVPWAGGRGVSEPHSGPPTSPQRLSGSVTPARRPLCPETALHRPQRAHL